MARLSVWLTGAVVVGLTACSDGNGSDDGVASLDGGETESATDDGAGGGIGEVEPGEVDDAFLEFVRCMREQGIDLPEPTADDMTITSPGPEIEAGHPGYEEAYEVCIPLVEEVTGSIEMTPEDVAAMQDHLLAEAVCMRERGYDYPDPEFGADGMPIPDDEAPQRDVPPERYLHDLNDCAAEVSSQVAEGSSGDDAEDE